MSSVFLTSYISSLAFTLFSFFACYLALYVYMDHERMSVANEWVMGLVGWVWEGALGTI